MPASSPEPLVDSLDLLLRPQPARVVRRPYVPADNGGVPGTPGPPRVRRILDRGPALDADTLAAETVRVRAHPLSFLREQLAEERIVRCGDLAGIRGDRFVEVPGVILVRQRPGSTCGVLFITIEDETGVANGILWPDRFEKPRGVVMSASMVSLRGRLQKEGQVSQVIVHRVVPRDDMLRSIGRMEMPVTFGRGDGATHAGAPDRGEADRRSGPRDLYSPTFPSGAEPEDMIRVRSHDFH